MTGRWIHRARITRILSISPKFATRVFSSVFVPKIVNWSTVVSTSEAVDVLHLSSRACFLWGALMVIPSTASRSFFIAEAMSLMVSRKLGRSLIWSGTRDNTLKRKKQSDSLLFLSFSEFRSLHESRQHVDATPPFWGRSFSDSALDIFLRVCSLGTPAQSPLEHPSRSREYGQFSKLRYSSSNVI